MIRRIALRYGDTERFLNIDDNNLLTLASVDKCIEGVRDVKTEIHSAMQNPLGGITLEHCVSKNSKVAIVVDDPSRPTPVKAVLEVLLAELDRLGLPDKNIRLVIGSGTHFSGGFFDMEEVPQKIGQRTVSRFGCRISDPDNKAELKYLGRTSRGTPIWVDRIVAESDVKICVGSVFTHRIAGYSGGAKLIVPGIAGRETIFHNHNLSLREEGSDPNMIGRVENPVRHDMEEAARKLGVDMCINTVLNMATNRVVKIIAGDIVEAHRAGVEAYNAIYRVTFENPADATITSAYHLDRCMDHGMKALALADLVTKIGGPIVLVGRFEKDADRLNRGDPMFDLMKAKVASSEIRGMVTKGDIQVKIASVPSILLSYSIIKEKHPLVLVSEGWSRQHAESVGFEHAETVDGAYRRILKRAERSKINVITMGNAIVPAFRL